MHRGKTGLALIAWGMAAAAAMSAVSAGEAARVRVRVDASGELFAPAGRDADPVRQPITVAGRFDFTEQPAAASAAPAAVVRTFADAAADITVDGRTTRVVLPDDARRLRVARIGAVPVPYLAEGFLTRSEVDLLDTPFDALLVDELQVKEAIAVGHTWTVPADAAAGLLAIDTIETGGLEARLEEVVDYRGRVIFEGIVEGAVDGVPTHVVVEGSCTIAASPDISSTADALRYRLDGGVTNVAVTLQERRQASHVAPGFDIEARVTMSRARGQAVSPKVADEHEAEGPRRRGEGRPGLVWHGDSGRRFDLVHDSRWRAVEETAGTLVMRYLDRGALVAQCSITALPPAPAAAMPTIAEVQRDIRRSLGDQFERFEGATEAARSDGVTVVRVESAGSAEKLPFRWVHYVLADAAGRRASVTFMMEVPLAKRFGDADQTLIDGLSLADDPAAREARLPRKTATP
jgi:hypothetical protein